MKTVVLTAAALVCFAANSLLCRLALESGDIDPLTFTTIRVFSGAAALGLLAARLRDGRPWGDGSWVSAAWLVVYAIPFSLAYVSLTAGTGALILFGAVQVTMLAMATATGSPPNVWETVGIVSAVGGLTYLVWPGLSAPPLGGAALMVLAGAAWGVYTLRGRSAKDPLALTAGNFLRATPFVALVSVVLVARADLHARGAMLAVASGAVTSGLGYIAWYAAVPRLGAVRSAAVQLGVPVLAALGGVVLLGEAVTARLGLGAVFVLGGVAVALTGRSRAI